jgi:hypothetical protein
VEPILQGLALKKVGFQDKVVRLMKQNINLRLDRDGRRDLTVVSYPACSLLVCLTVRSVVVHKTPGEHVPPAGLPSITFAHMLLAHRPLRLPAA